MNDTPQWAVDGVNDHPQRSALTNEIHARPALALRAPVQVSHLALLSGETAADNDQHNVAALCRRFSAPAPPAGSNFWHVDLGAFRLNWERHTEFSTYTFIRNAPLSSQQPFAEAVIDRVPQDWLKTLGGTLLVAIHLTLLDRDAEPTAPAQLTALFASDNVAASRPAAGAATVWTDFRLQGDGFSRFLVHDHSLGERQAGRLVQRLLEIETYRMMALLALPLARRLGPQITAANRTLAAVTERMAQAGRGADVDEQKLLGQLSQLAAEVERLAVSAGYRFSASRAYYDLVQRRLDELREQRVSGRSPIQEFMQRRLAPAVRTCESVNERIEVLSGRVSRASNLLRTQVDVALEQQNRDLLSSMDRRAEAQLRLQQTVEGLSIVVLSYYLVSLAGYLLKALKAGGVAIDAELATGVAVPLALIAVWFGLRAARRRLERRFSSSSES